MTAVNTPNKNAVGIHVANDLATEPDGALCG